MFVELRQKETVFTINVNKIQVYYPVKDGTRIEMEDGTIIDVIETYDAISEFLRGFSLLLK